MTSSTSVSTISLLGRPAVDGHELGGSVAPTVLALLAIRSPAAIEAEVLIDQIYGFDVPSTADKALQNQIVKLRRALDGSPMAIETVGTAYRLVGPEEEIDLFAIERAAGRGDVAALDRFRSSWRARPYASCRPSDWIDAAQAGARRQLAAAVVAWADGANSLGVADRVIVGELEFALVENPYDEALWLALASALVALDDAGELAAAQARATRVFVDDLGVDVPAALVERLGEPTGTSAIVPDAERLPNLRPELVEVVMVVGLVDGPVDLGTVARALERSPTATLGLLDAAIASGFVRSTSVDGDLAEVEATSALDETLVGALDEDSRRRVHRRLAAAFDGPDATTRARRAHHRLEAVASADADLGAVEEAVACGTSAYENDEPFIALEWFRRARSIAARDVGSPMHIETLTLEARLLGMVGRIEEAGDGLVRACDLAVARRDIDGAVWAAIELGRHRDYMPSRAYRPLPSLADAAELGLSGVVKPAELALLHAALAREASATRDHDRVAHHAAQAVAAAETSGDDEALASAALVERLALAHEPERIDQWIDCSNRAERHAARVVDDSLRRRVLAARAIDAVTTGDLGLLGNLNADPNVTLGPNAYVARLQFESFSVAVASSQGRYDDAHHRLSVIEEMATDPTDLTAIATMFYARSALAFDRGYEPDLVVGSELAAASVPALAARTALGVVYATVGRIDDARRVIVEACNPTPAVTPRDDTWLLGLSFTAYASWLIDEPIYGAALHEILRPFAHLFACPASGPMPWLGSVALHAGSAAVLAGRHGEALDLAEQAAKAHREIGSTPWILRSDLVRADALARRADDGDRAEAASIVERTRNEAERLGATMIVELADRIEARIS